MTTAAIAARMVATAVGIAISVVIAIAVTIVVVVSVAATMIMRVAVDHRFIYSDTSRLYFALFFLHSDSCWAVGLGLGGFND